MMVFGKSVPVVQESAQVDVLPTLVFLFHAAGSLLVSGRGAHPIIILHFILGGLTVLLYHLIGGIGRERESLDESFEIVGCRYIPAKSRELIPVSAAVEQSSKRIAAARERVVWITILIVNGPEPLVHPSLSYIGGWTLAMTLLVSDIG